MDVNVRVPAIEKLLDYTASGIGGTASFLFSRMVARRDAEARLISAEGEARANRALAEGQANTTRLIAKAQADARSILVSPDAVVDGEVTFGAFVDQRIHFQEQKRQSNIESAFQQAASELGEREVQDHQVDHDWTARFFSDVQDVSSEQMQTLWAKILAGEVTNPGSTSLRALSILRNLNQDIASLFAKFCCLCVFLRIEDPKLFDARVPILGGNREGNALREYGIDYGSLNLLNEYGLIVSEYNSWRDYNASITSWPSERKEGMRVIPFSFQGRYWLLTPMTKRNAEQEFRLNGVALTASGQELSMVVELSPDETFANDLKQLFSAQKLQMVQVDSGLQREA